MPKIVDHEERRQAIAKTAMRVIAAKGLEASKLSDIAKQAGVTTDAITHYFADKDSVLNAALEISHKLTFSAMDQERAKAKASLLSVLQYALPINEKSRCAMSVWLAFWSQSMVKSLVADRQTELHLQWHAKVEENVIFFCNKKNISTPKNLKDCCESITAFINGIIIRGVMDPDNWPAARQKKLLKKHLSDQGL